MASLNANLFVTPRILYGMSRDGLAPKVLAGVSRGGTPVAALLTIGVIATKLAATGTFETLLGIVMPLVLVTDIVAVLALLPLRRRGAGPAFVAPGGNVLPVAFAALYAVLFVASSLADPRGACVALGLCAVTYVVAARMGAASRAPAALASRVL